MTNLLAVAAAAAALAFVAARIVFPSTPSAQPAGPSLLAGGTPGETGYWQASPEPEPSVTATTPALPGATEPSLHREYAVALPDLRGLPLDAVPGTPLELWVAWDDAYAEKPQIQKLVKSVTVARFIEPVTAEGALVVVLSVPQRSMRAVMYGDRFGSFSVALPTSS